MNDDMLYDLEAIARTASTLPGGPWELRVRFNANGTRVAALVPAIDGPTLAGNGPSLGSALADLAEHPRIVRNEFGR